MQNLSRSFISLGLHLWTALFNSDHMFSIGFKSGDWDGHCKTLILFSQNHFCVDFEVCLGSLSCWKVHLWPSLSFLAEATRFLAKMSWYLVELIMPLILTRAPGPWKPAPKHQWSTISCLAVGPWCALILDWFTLLTPNMPITILVSTDLSVRACWYAGGILWLILRLCDPKTQLKSVVVELWSLGSSLPPFTSFLTVRAGQHALASCNMHFPGKFATVPDVWNVLIIATNSVWWYVWTVYVFFCTNYLTCLGQQPSVSFDLTVLWHSPWWWMTKGFYMCVLPHFYTLVKQEVMEGHNTVP